MKKGLTVITGGNSGNGKAIALRLINLGYPILVLDIRIDEIKNEIEKNIEFSKISMISKANVTNYEEFQKRIKEAEDKFGPITNMINNAGIMILEKSDTQEPKQMEAMIDINFKGVVFGTQIALKSMIKEKTGTIINISSIAGIKGFSNHAVYCGTKFAVRGYTETVRAEVALHGIRVALISPGVVKTNLLEGTTNNQIKKDYKDWRDKSNAFIEANDIADAVIYIIQQKQNVLIREIVIGPVTQVE